MKQLTLLYICIFSAISMYAQTMIPVQQDSALFIKDSFVIINPFYKKPPVFLSASSLFSRLNYDKANNNINAFPLSAPMPDYPVNNISRIVFNPVYNYAYNNSSNKKWQGITTLAGYALLTFIGQKNNFNYIAPQYTGYR